MRGLRIIVYGASMTEAREICLACDGKKWTTFFRSAPSPCKFCTDGKTLTQIEAERSVKIMQDENGEWFEAPLS